MFPCQQNNNAILFPCQQINGDEKAALPQWGGLPVVSIYKSVLI